MSVELLLHFKALLPSFTLPAGFETSSSLVGPNAIRVKPTYAGVPVARFLTPGFMLVWQKLIVTRATVYSL
jgi:hypothetical protein